MSHSCSAISPGHMQNASQHACAVNIGMTVMLEMNQRALGKKPIPNLEPAAHQKKILFAKVGEKVYTPVRVHVLLGQ